MPEKIEYDIKREWVENASVAELKAHAEYIRAEVIPAGFRLHSVIPMASKGQGLVSFLEIYTKG